MLETLLVQFAEYLRNSQITVPISSLEEAVRLLPKISYQKRFVFETSVRQLWIKDVSQYEKFHLCFEEFFFQQAKGWMKKQEEEQKRQKKQNENMEFEQKIEKKIEENKIEEWIKEKIQHHSKSELLKKVVEKNTAYLFEHAEQLASFGKSEIQQVVEDLMWDAISEGKEAKAFDGIQKFGDFLENIRKEILKFKTAIKESEESAEKTEFRGMRKVVQTEIDELKNRKIKELSAKDVRKLRDAIQETSSHFLTQIGRVLRTSQQSDVIDIEKVIAKSVETFGVPMELMYQKPKKNRTKIKALIDVSGSLRKVAYFLSTFLYLIHENFPRQMQGFVFVGMLAEVTEFYQYENLEEAVRASLELAPIDYKAYSNYGGALEDFWELQGEEIDRDTILLILGDGRNNRNSPREDLFSALTEKAYATFWINPEKKEKWNTGDSMIDAYEPYCQQIYEIETMQQLETVLYSMAETLSEKTKGA